MTLTVLLLVALLQTAAPGGRIRSVTGEVDLVRVADRVLAQPGDIVLAGDRLHTSKGSALTLSMDSGLLLVLGADTSVEMKSVKDDLVALVTEGKVTVVSSGKPARIETKYGSITGTDDFQQFEVNYSGDVVQVLLAGGGVRAEVSDPLKVFFKNAHNTDVRVYDAGSISPTVPREKGESTVIVYPQVETAPIRNRIIPPK